MLIVEDDHFGPLAQTPTLTLVSPERVSWAVVRSVSKFLGPDLRLALMFGDETTVRRVKERQAIGLQWVSHILQRAVLEMYQSNNVPK